jgi:hypothetical protein
MKIKQSLLLLATVLTVIELLSISCNSNNDQEIKTDAAPASNLFLDLGYKNCLMCHGSGDKNINKNLTPHCLHFDPEGYLRINSEDYSPSLSDCLLCHTTHDASGKRTTYECGRCHYG